MARRGLFRRIIDLFRPEPAAPRERTQGERDFGRGKRVSAKDAERYAQRARDNRATRNYKARQRTAERRAERQRREAPYSQSWSEQTLTKPGRAFRRHRELFDAIPGIDEENPTDREELWDAYVQYMVMGKSPYRRNDPRNPWWGIIGMDPDNFDWHEYKESMKGGPS